MKKQPYPVAQLTGGIDVSVDPVFLMDKASPNLQNVFMHKSLVKKGMGWKAFSANSCNGTVMLIDSFPMASGVTPFLVGTENHIYQYTSGNDTFTVKSDAGNAFTGDTANGFRGAPALLANGADAYVLTNGIDPIKYWEGGGANFANLGEWASETILAGEVVYFKNRLIAGNTTESGTASPRRCRWSVAGDIANVTGTGSGFVDLADTSDWIVCFAIMKDKLFVIKERSIWELEYVGGTTVFTPAIRIDGVGSYSANSVIPLDEEMILYGTDNVYLFDGFSLRPAGGSIYPLLYETDERIVNVGMAQKVAAAYIEELKVYIMSLVHKDKTVPDLVFRYDFDLKAWTKETKEMTAIGYFDIENYTSWNDLTDNWEDWGEIWISRQLAPRSPTTLIGNSDGEILEDDRLTTSTDYMCYETKDFIFSHAVRWAEFRMLVTGGPFQVSYSTDGGTTWSNPHTFAVLSDWDECSLPLNLTSRKIRFKMECVDGDATDFQIKWLEPWYVPRARSKALVTA